MDPRAHKLALAHELADQLRAALAAAEEAHAAAMAAATHAEAKPENDKDTRGLEQSYVARGQARRVAELGAALAVVESWAPRVFAARDAVALGALVTLDEDDAPTQVLLIAPHGGGLRLERGRVLVVTPESPAGQALLGKRAGDDAEIVVAGKPPRQRDVTIVAIV